MICLAQLPYLLGRTDVDKAGIGVIGFSMGANTILYALPQNRSKSVRRLPCSR